MQDGDKLVTKTYNTEGEVIIPNFTVHELNNEIVRDLNFETNVDKILFTWSGRKIDEGNYDIYTVVYDLDLVTDVRDNTEISKFHFNLEQNYPNPFNPTTVINYSIPTTENHESSFVQLKIYDLIGREVATIVSSEQKAGNYKVQFDASKLSSGIYFYTLNTGDFKETKKMLFLK